jgi:hypothetical protein
MRERLAVMEPLRLVSVAKIGATLRLVVRDRRRKRFVISFYFDCAGDARAQRVRMKHWIAEKTRLAYVRGKDESALIEIDALLARASV